MNNQIVLAAAAIVDIWSANTAWRSRLDGSDFLESADWQNALELAQAAITAYNPDNRLREALAENANLTHDLERQMTIANIECNLASELQAEVDRLTAELAAARALNPNNGGD